MNVLSPGTIDTGIFYGIPNDLKDAFVAMIPRGAIGRPEEIAVTGIELFVDGGVGRS